MSLLICVIFTISCTNLDNSASKLNTKISWVPITPLSRETDKTTTSSSAMCLPGTQCQDVVVFQTEVENYYACTLDDQCSFFKGFMGVQTGVTATKTSVPAQVRGSTPASTQPPGGGAPTSNLPLPIAVDGSEGCFNKKELLKIALNKDGLKEDGHITCECGIQPPSSFVAATPTAINGSSGEVITPGTMSRVKNPLSRALSCMKKGMFPAPDIMTENFIFPKSVNINSPFSVSFDYKNVGVVGCMETVFQADITRTVTGQSEYLGGTEAHISYATPLNPDDGDTFTFGSQFLIPFDLAGDYKLDLTMECELPRETHVVNNMKEIHIQVD